MKVSVIVSLHRGENYLKDCLTSLEVQNLPELEVILVCDHVTEFDVDKTVDPFRKQLLIRMVELDDKTGVAAARNLGLSVAEGEYIYFLDSDDYIFENTVEQLLDTAQEYSVQVVYGKKERTWNKRDIFISSYERQMPAAEKENEEEQNALTEKEQDEDAQDDALDSKAVKARKRLLSSRRGIKNVSVLNILIKRDLIESNQIRFCEDFRYYSDLSFVLEILKYGESFECSQDAVYVQRKHNDPIHYPALSQEKNEKRFGEFLAAYRYGRERIEDDSELRDRLDRKLINYYCGYFMKRMRRSERAVWREERFDQMRELIGKMSPDLIESLKKYKRKCIKALLEGNRKKSLRLINARLGKQKFKTFFTRPKEIGKYLYRHYFRKMSLKENYVVCESFFGKSYSDSPKYIYEYISEHYPGQYKFIWVLNNKKTHIPYPHKRVKRFGIRYAYYMARSKYFVFNVRTPLWVKKREGAIFLETWHGTPLKRLVFDQEEVTGASPTYKKQFYVQVQEWDYLVAANQFSSVTFRSCFQFKKKMLEYGYPRNDLMYREDKDELAAKLRGKLGIPADKKTILYAPTWRDDEYYDKGQYKFALKLDLARMKKELGDEYVILLRTHYYIADALDVTGLEDFAFNLSKYDDITELYLISDLLITDYSSVFFDYANLKRPVLFYTYDLEKYRDNLRGFYIDIEKEVPGPILYTEDEVIDAVKHIGRIEEEYRALYEEFYERFCSWEDGHASENCAKEVFGLK
ncbi:CDP-glycerol:glycerophosphate glycerophosphotransferase [Anaerolentibacter hominis]|uniref:bifunctional glycosyltransferase/CDP-glycerol:glycerophosphate glycerophosphotransferase n=1 Tax=Anaerolentibacter hominis TaxID=3079009 RepID=UPI0031B7F934